MMNKKTYKELKEILANNVDLVVEIANNLKFEGVYELKNFAYEENGEEFFEMFFRNNPAEVARAIYFGNYNFNDEYIKFNAYNNLVTTTEYQLKEKIEKDIDYIIQVVIKNKNLIDISDDKVNKLLGI